MALTVLAYFLVPLGSEDARIGPRIVATVALFAVLVWAIVRQMRTDPEAVGILAILLVLVVVGFALTFYGVEQADPGQFTELHTRTDALYFTVTMMATVGFGDVHPVGQTARALVTLAIAFDVIVVASLARAIARAAGSRVTSGRHPTTDRTEDAPS